MSIGFWPLYLLIVCSALAGAGLVSLSLRRVWRWLRTRGEPDPGKRAARPSPAACGFGLLGGVALAALAAAGLGLLGTIAGYRACAEKTLCATVRAEPLPRQAGRIWLELTPVDRGTPGRKQVYILNGDQWRVEGHVLRWSGWARLLGLRTCYRLTRIDGRYRSAVLQRERRPTVVDLGGEENWLWVKLQEHGQRLPGVEAVWGGGAHLAPDPAAVFEVYATPGGYLITRKP